MSLAAWAANKGYDIIHAIVVTVESRTQQQAVLERTPPAALGCPLPEPVCDANRNCY